MPENKFITPANLCTCNNCGTIFIDQNPKADAKIYKIDTTKISNLQYQPDSVGEMFWGCGVCFTDDFLSDEVSEKLAQQLGMIE